MEGKSEKTLVGFEGKSERVEVKSPRVVEVNEYNTYEQPTEDDYETDFQEGDMIEEYPEEGYPEDIKMMKIGNQK